MIDGLVKLSSPGRGGGEQTIVLKLIYITHILPKNMNYLIQTITHYDF